MSWWTSIHGTIHVEPIGRTQAEKRYVLDTVLNHLPIVSGSERDMDVYVIQPNGANSHCSHDEFGQRTNNLIDSYGQKNRNGWLETQDEYILVVDASLRDRMFDETFKEFQNWLCRLAKRVLIENILVEISAYEKSYIIRDENDRYSQMFEPPTWGQKKEAHPEPNWCEYMLWDNMKGCQYPLMLGYKYINDKKNDKEAERRLKFS